MGSTLVPYTGAERFLRSSLCNSAAAKERAGLGRTQLQKMALAAARAEREAAELRMQDDARRLGALTVARAGPIGNSSPSGPLHHTSACCRCWPEASYGSCSAGSGSDLYRCPCVRLDVVLRPEWHSNGSLDDVQLPS